MKIRRKRRGHTGIYHVVLRQENQFSVSTKDYMHAWYFTLSNFASSHPYDYYRINCIVVKFTPCQGGPYVREGNVRVFNYGWTDFDDVDPPVVIDINRQNLKKWSSDRSMSFKIWPKVLMKSGGPMVTRTTSNQIVKPGWMNTVYPDVTHMGLKTVFQKPRAVGSTVAQQLNYNVQIKAYVSFKQPAFHAGITAELNDWIFKARYCVISY